MCVRTRRPPLLRNIRLKFSRQPLESWIPQEEFLGIIGTGDGCAIASKGALAVEGEEMWHLKDHIDRTWMSGYQDLPDLDKMMAEKVGSLFY